MSGDQIVVNTGHETELNVAAHDRAQRQQQGGNPGHQGRIPVGGREPQQRLVDPPDTCLEEAVEKQLGPAENLPHPARFALARQVGGQDKQRLDQGDGEHRDGHRRNIEEEFPRRAGHEHERQKGDDIGQDGKHDRSGDLSHPFNRSLHERQAALASLIDVFSDDDRVINNDAQRDNKRKERDHVDRRAAQRHEQEGAHDRDRDAQGDPEGELGVEEQAQQEQDQGQAEKGVFQQQAHPVAVDLGEVVPDRYVDPRRQPGQEIVEVGADAGRNRLRGFLGHPIDVDLDGGLIIVKSLEVGIFKPIRNLGNIADRNARTVRG